MISRVIRHVAQMLQLLPANRHILQEPDLVPVDSGFTMASCRNDLDDRDISKLTDIVSSRNRHRFAVEYLGINPNEYNIIESEAQFIHHDTVFECIRRWKNRIETTEKYPKDELVRILTQIRKEHGWFSGDDIAFLTDVERMEIPQTSKKFLAKVI